MTHPPIDSKAGSSRPNFKLTHYHAATSYQRSSRDAYLQRLGARDLVETRGRDVKALGNLFD
jgi:hypothetical protein